MMEANPALFRTARTDMLGTMGHGRKVDAYFD
jgi:hypothetical protein